MRRQQEVGEGRRRQEKVVGGRRRQEELGGARRRQEEVGLCTWGTDIPAASPSPGRSSPVCEWLEWVVGVAGDRGTQGHALLGLDQLGCGCEGVAQSGLEQWLGGRLDFQNLNSRILAILHSHRQLEETCWNQKSVRDMQPKPHRLNSQK